MSASMVQSMDVNYSRWMSKDPDAEPDVIEDEPRRFRFPWPSRSAVASTAMVSLIVVGGAAFVRSMATPEVTTNQAQTAESPTAKESDGPGAASVDDSMSDDSISDDLTADDVAADDTAPDDSASVSSADDGTFAERPAPSSPRFRELREFRQPGGVPPGGPPGGPWPDRPPRLLP